MARNIRIGRGSASVVLSDDLQGYANRIIDNAMPHQAREIERAAKELHDDAQGKWPVKTGRSKRAFEHGLRIYRRKGEEVLSGFVSNDEDHTYKIKSAQSGLKGRHAWTWLVRKPFHRMALDLGERLGDLMRRDAKSTKVAG